MFICSMSHFGFILASMFYTKVIYISLSLSSLSPAPSLLFKPLLFTVPGLIC